MIWAFLAANLKWIILGILGGVGAYVFRDNGKKTEKLKYIEGQNKKLIHLQTYQVMEIKRSEEQAKNARDFSLALEKKLMEIDPASLSSIELSRVSEDPLGFTDLLDRTGEPTQSREDEDDK